MKHAVIIISFVYIATFILVDIDTDIDCQWKSWGHSGWIDTFIISDAREQQNYKWRKCKIKSWFKKPTAVSSFQVPWASVTALKNQRTFFFLLCFAALSQNPTVIVSGPYWPYISNIEGWGAESAICLSLKFFNIYWFIVWNSALFIFLLRLYILVHS